MSNICSLPVIASMHHYYLQNDKPIWFWTKMVFYEQWSKKHMILRWGKRWKHADTAWESFVTTQLKQFKLLNNTMQSCWGRSYKGPGVGKDTRLWSTYRYLKRSTSHSRAIASLIEITNMDKMSKVYKLKLIFSKIHSWYNKFKIDRFWDFD